jgi:melanoma-associated antigen p97
LLAHTALVLTVDFNWCTKSFPGLQKCEELQNKYQSAGSLDFSCTHDLASGGCLNDVASEPATLTSVNPGALYHAQREGAKYKVILAEDYSSSLSDTLYRYYSVAVVKAGRSDLKLLKLKGKKICHSAYDYLGTNGWDIPISYLYTYHRKFEMNDRCSILDSINRYFGPSCLPDPSGIIRDNMRLCAACSSRTCSTEVRYKGYSGAFRCLVEDAGEVAFLKHSTVSELTDGKSFDSWTAGLKSSDYRLLCPDGSQVTVENYVQCFIGWMRPNAVVLGQDVSSSATTQIQNNLRNPPLRAADLIFETSRYTSLDGVDVIFSGETKELRVVEGREQNPRYYLGADSGARYQFAYTRAMDGLYCVTGDAHTLKIDLLIILLAVFNDELFFIGKNF